MMDDLISRQAAIDAIVNTVSEIGSHDNSEVARYGVTFRQHEIINILEQLPSARSDVSDRNVGEWDMFELITSTWYGKRCYFKERGGTVYSRVSRRPMSIDDAIREFLDAIGDNG